MLHIGQAVHQRQPNETLRRVGHNVQEHVEHHSLLQNKSKTVYEHRTNTEAVSSFNQLKWVWVCVCVCLPVGGSRSVLRFVCSQRKALHIRQWAAWEPPSEIDQTWIVPIHRWSQIPEKTHLHTHTRVHTQNEEGSLKYYMSKPQCLP